MLRQRLLRRSRGLLLRILVVCVGNSGRSVIAERLLRRAGFDARSAGSAPSGEADRGVLAALAEIGVDASDHVPQKLTDELVEWADVVVAACDEACPYVPGKRYENWKLRDPKGRPPDEIREIRDEIAARVNDLAGRLGRPAASG